MPSQAVDTIRGNLSSLGQTKWGLVIYRCTYSNDELWETLLQRMRDSTAENFADEGDEGDALLDQLQWTIIEDKERFENASKQTVRSAFQQWVDQTTKDTEAPGSRFEPKDSPAPRYRYCLHIDDAALQSAVDPDATEEAYINLIKRRWPNRSFLPQRIQEQLQRDEEQDDDGDDDEDELSEVEGCKDADVGFMKVDPDLVYPGAYGYLDNGSDWHLLYVRPPAVGPA